MFSKTVGNLMAIPFLTPEHCQQIIESSTDWIEGTVQKFSTPMTDREHRSVEIARSNLPEEFMEQVFQRVFRANRQNFRFHLEGYDINDLPRVFKYSAERKDHYVWHRDTLTIPSKESERKLSFSIQLSDPNSYQGGDLEFLPDMPGIYKRAQGSLLIFPSYLTHRVSAVTQGTRYVIVGWIHGPMFK